MFRESVAGLHVKLEVQVDESRERSRTKDIGNVLPCRLVRLGRERNGFLVLEHIAHRYPYLSTDASVRLQQAEDLCILTLDVLLQFLPSDRQVFENGLDRYCCAPLGCNDRGILQLAGGLEIQSSSLGGLIFLCRNNMHRGEGAERGERLSAKTKGA